MPSLPVPTDVDISRVFIVSSAFELVVATHPVMTSERRGLVSRQAKPVEDGAPFLFTPINKNENEIKEKILDVRFPKQKNR
ncbi:hypothetical protein TNCV_1701961 [Trichonephila clavipes]|nr:hypothetical protein TNCV_1701961 [Trichonephila clavipes]